MTTTTHATIDRDRVEELTDAQKATLADRTPKSGALYERAKEHLTAGVPSSYQVRKPWPIYVSRGKGSHLWDVDGNEYADFHSGFGAMIVGHAHPAVVAAVNRAVS